MKSILVLFYVLVSVQAFSQIARSYNFSGSQPVSSGTYMEKHPFENSYFTASAKILPEPGTLEISLAKLNNQGQSSWYQKIQVDNTIHFSGIGDLAISNTHIYLSAVIDPLLSGSRMLLLKYDLNGNLLDSNYITPGGTLANVKSELKIDSDGFLVTTLKTSTGHIHFYKIDPVTLAIVNQQVVGHSSYGNNYAQRWHCVQTIGSTTVVAYNDVDSIQFVVLDPAASVTSNFSIHSTEGSMTDLEYHNGLLCILVNKHFNASVPADNPLRIIFTDLTGIIYSNLTVAVENPVVFENLAFDDDNNTYVVSRSQQLGATYGTIIKLNPSLTLVYEYPLFRSDLSEAELHGNRVIISGNHTDRIVDYDNQSTGHAFISIKTSDVPAFEVVAPHMSFASNNINCFVSFNDKDFENTYAPANSGYIVNGGGNTLYINSLMLAGEDINGNLNSYIGTYYNNCAAGPITNPATYTQTERDKWQRVWKVSKAEIDAHVDAFLNGDASYKIPEAILHWPGNGDPSKGQDAQLARYLDMNSNLVYEPQLGEYPLIKGDFCVLSVYNDINNDTAEVYQGMDSRMHVQIFEYIYGFDCNADSSLQNALFIHYDIQNSLSSTAYNTYIGHFADTDINTANDDYISSDPIRGVFYGRNANGSGPEQAYLLLGSTADADGLDNATGIGSAESPNGYGYADGITDNERLGMTHFYAYSNAIGPAPSTMLEYYQSMYVALPYAGTGIQTNFAYPGDSDDLLWYSTGGIDPGFSWSEESSGNPAGDRRGIASSGPFTFHPDDTLYFDVVYVTGLENTTAGYTGHENMLTQVDSVKAYYKSGVLPCGQNFDYYVPYIGPYPYLELPEQLIATPVLFPNPTHGIITIQGLPENSTLTVYTTSGQLISSESISKNNVTYDFKDLPQGIYFVTIQSETYSGTIRFVKQ